ncbi:RNA deprotection pyrophosphohydrolase [Ornithinibacillus halophilus]|uniref:8-oxo-dGTPase n=1 Tax=Ornithinibacillus halophilus TaxID=930117 RepID=A0A1M5K7P7_9BACI|nr:nucleoside triphosphatase YtkD [Ornithinibacillus halophilus]SHG48862.1 8-oxo-dGTPase [Ornithinibacillus halophilus]
MYKFKDYYHNEVKFSFNDHPFSQQPKHVWVICQYKNQWLLTKHKERGLEFPGGKVEVGETAEDAAIREVKEETGGIVDSIRYVGQYHVAGKSDEVIKNVYFAKIQEIEYQQHYFETEGPVLLEEIPGNVKEHHAYSFIMKDDVLTHSMKKLLNK